MTDNSSSVEIAPGLVKVALHEGRILILQVSTVSRETLDAGYEIVAQAQQKCGSDTPFLLVYHLVSPTLTITPYMRTLVLKLNAMNPHVKGRVAVVLPKSATTVIFKVFVTLIRSTNRPKRIFFTLPEAVAWLEELL